MSNAAANLQSLIDLAKEPSSEKRRELLRSLTDVFLDAAPDYGDAERNHFGAILSRVAADMDVAVRRQLSKQFANVPSAPHDLIAKLAGDEDFAVARDVLLKSTVLRDEDLVAVAGAGAQDRLELIAARHSVSEAVSEALVEHGDDHVLTKLVSNAGANFSRKAMRRVVERSETSAALQAPLAARADVPADMLKDMLDFVSNELRVKLADKLEAMDPALVEKAFAEAAKELTGEMRHAKEGDRRAMLLINELARRKLLNEAMLQQLLRGGQMTEFVHAFARLGDIDVKTAHRLINARNTEGIAVVCRAQRFDRATFAMIALHLEATAKRPAGTHAVLELYDKVSAEAAQRVMRFWRVRKEAVEQQPQPIAKAG